MPDLSQIRALILAVQKCPPPDLASQRANLDSAARELWNTCAKYEPDYESQEQAVSLQSCRLLALHVLDISLPAARHHSVSYQRLLSCANVLSTSCLANGLLESAQAASELAAKYEAELAKVPADDDVAFLQIEYYCARVTLVG